jgi:hypothetical protein
MHLHSSSLKESKAKMHRVCTHIPSSIALKIKWEFVRFEPELYCGLNFLFSSSVFVPVPSRDGHGFGYKTVDPDLNPKNPNPNPRVYGSHTGHRLARAGRDASLGI